MKAVALLIFKNNKLLSESFQFEDIKKSWMPWQAWQAPLSRLLGANAEQTRFKTHITEVANDLLKLVNPTDHTVIRSETFEEYTAHLLITASDKTTNFSEGKTEDKIGFFIVVFNI